MSPQSQKISAAPSAAVNGVNNAESSDAMHLIGDFQTIVKTFSSDDIYKKVARLVEEIPQLRSQVEDREKQLKRFEDQFETLKTTHKTAQQESLAVYSDARDELERQKAAVMDRVSSLETDVNQRGSTIADLDGKNNELQLQTRQLKETSDEQKATLKKAKKKVTDLQSEMKEKDDKIQSLNQVLKQEKDRVSQLRNETDQLKEDKASLTKKLETNDTRLREVEGFAEPLREEEIDVS